MTEIVELAAAVALVGDGTTVGFGGAVNSRKPVAFVAELAASGRTGLHVVSFAASFEVDLLVGAGAVASVSSGYVGFGHAGRPPHFVAAVEGGRIEDREYTEWLLLDRLRAASMGKPFLPTRAAIGSDILKLHDFRTVTDPYSDERYVAAPALNLDVAVLHAWRGSEDGYVQFPWPPDHLWDLDAVVARAATTTIVTVDEVVDRSVIDAAAERTVLFPVDVDVIVAAPGGAWPTGSRPAYGEDHDAIRAYVRDGRLPERSPHDR